MNYQIKIYALLENENTFIYKKWYWGVLTKPIKIIDNIKIDNVYEELIRLEEQGNIKIYRYPQIPEGYKWNNEDIIMNCFQQKRNGKTIIILPRIKDRIKWIYYRKQLGSIYSDEDLIKLFEFYLSYYKKKLRENKYRDNNLELINLQYSNYFIIDKRVHNLIEIDYQASKLDNINRKRYLYRTSHKYNKEEWKSKQTLFLSLYFII